MTTVDSDDIQDDFVGYLQRVTAGETLVIMQAGQLVAELKPFVQAPKQLRPFALCVCQFTVLDDFDAALPNDVLNQFEGR